MENTTLSDDYIYEGFSFEGDDADDFIFSVLCDLPEESEK